MFGFFKYIFKYFRCCRDIDVGYYEQEYTVLHNSFYDDTENTENTESVVSSSSFDSDQTLEL